MSSELYINFYTIFIWKSWAQKSASCIAKGAVCVVYRQLGAMNVAQGGAFVVKSITSN